MASKVSALRLYEYTEKMHICNFPETELECSIWNSLATAPGWLNFDIGNVFCIIMRYSMKLRSLMQYFFVLGKSIFLHFPSIWNKFIEIVSRRFEMPIKSSIY
ncbi:hypothetical protein T07_11221 [Trichinella nelsoni]|uniref:Uncharacterized protein n=1 Tax=Trichinella nelsoni TaxID=6336 RepID=A0A0V0S090_9BILA|nr:hypothetical protein T07_11221 [Trichinella nelsoni]